MLSRMSGLFVVAQYSTAVYKGQTVDVKQIGQELGVRYVLEGSVQKSRDRIRVTAQLIDSISGHHKWADRYDRQLDDIFTVQDDITRNVIVNLQIQFTGEIAQTWSIGTKNLQAWERVVRGIEAIDLTIKEDTLRGRRLAEEAVLLDPEYVWGWILLGWTHVDAIDCGWAESIDGTLEGASEAAQRAHKVNDTHPDVYALQSAIYRVGGDLAQAIELSEKAAACSPGSSDIQAFLSQALNYAGRAKEAITHIEKAMRLAPVYPNWYALIYAQSLCMLGQIDDAIALINETVERTPESATPRLHLVWALIEGGFYDKARLEAERVLRLEPAISAQCFVQGRYHEMEKRDGLMRDLLKVGLPE